MNGLERAYAEHLEVQRLAGEVAFWAFEPFALRLAKKTRYTVDFLIVLADGTTELHEVKAQWSTGKAGFKDDARVKTKVAAELYWIWQFVVAVGKTRAKRDGGGVSWRYECIDP